MPGTRRLPSRHELAIWRDFIEATELLRTAIAARLQDDAGLSMGDYAVLLAFTEAPDIARPTWPRPSAGSAAASLTTWAEWNAPG